jgi:hypothetical protein
MKALLPMLTMLLALLSPAAFAQALNDDQLSAEVQSVDEASRTLEVKIIDAGADIEANPGDVESYYVGTDTDIRYEIDSLLYETYADFKLSEIERGDRVILDFDDAANRTGVRTVRNVESRNVATRERIISEGRRVEDDTAAGERDRTERQLAAQDDRSTRTALPDSASALPALALIGLLLAGVAGVLRRLRN